MKILVLEDQRALADAIVHALKTAKFIVDIVDRVSHARAALATSEYRAALFDLSLPDGDSMTLIRELRAARKTMPIIIMTARDKISERILGLEAGADDYVVKPFSIDELIARLNAVIRRATEHPTPFVSIGRCLIDRNGRQVMVGETSISLTAKEWAILDKLTERPGSVVSKERLRSALNGFDDEVVSNTLEVFINRLRKKLGPDSIETQRGVGYRFNPDSGT